MKVGWRQFVSKKFSVSRGKPTSPLAGLSALSVQINFQSTMEEGGSLQHLVAFVEGLGNLRLEQILEEKDISVHLTCGSTTHY